MPKRRHGCSDARAVNPALHCIFAAEIAGEDRARWIQLYIEYAPAPPFDSGSPRTAAPALVEEIRASRRAVQAERRRVLEEIAAKPRS